MPKVFQDLSDYAKQSIRSFRHRPEAQTRKTAQPSGVPAVGPEREVRRGPVRAVIAASRCGATDRPLTRVVLGNSLKEEICDQSVGLFLRSPWAIHWIRIEPISIAMADEWTRMRASHETAKRRLR